MGSTVSDSLKTLKPLRAKLVKKLNKDVQAKWDEFLKNTDDCIAELEKIEASGLDKARAEYDKRKNDLETLKAAVNAGSAKAMASHRKALDSRNKALSLMNDIGKAMKSDDPAFKDYRTGFMYVGNTQKWFPDIDRLGPLQ
ncbi:MAG: hypothetical protein ABI281_03330 [Caldimonas sp.]